MNENIQDLSQQQQSVDYKVILFKFYRYWYLFAVTVFIALIIAFIFNKYTPPVYEVKTSVLIKDKSENKMNPQDLLGMGLFNNMQNLQNEIGVLSSYSLTFRTVTKIGFEVAYSCEENFVTKELYRDSPFEVVMDTSYPQPIGVQFNVNFISKDKFRLEARDEEVKMYIYSRKQIVEDRKENIVIDETYSVGQLIQNKNFKFKLLLTDNFDPQKDLKRSFSFVFKDYDGLVKEFKSFSLEPINKELSMAGDMTEFANRNRVALIRLTKGGSQVHYLDMTSDKILNSEYYYLQPNDIIYVLPLGYKRWGFGTTFPWAIVLTSISTALLLINYFKK